MTEQRSRLDADAWQKLVLDRYTEDMRDLASRISNGYLDALARPLLAETQPGWRVLETGSGWGSISATLALEGRLITLMDWSNKIVGHGLALLAACGTRGTGVCADLSAPLPFSNKSFDCVWSSGVLEHFPRQEQVRILTESARVAKHNVISLIPNASSLAYRLGKWQMMRKGTWEFGYEQPEYTQKRLFRSAGLKNIRETTVHAERSGWFLDALPAGKQLRRAWSKICRTMPEVINGVARQGYMLVTIGEVV